MHLQQATRYVQDLVNLFLPHGCLICGFPIDKSIRICPLCQSQLPFTNFWKHPSNPLFEQISARVPCEFASACFYFIKKSPVQQILHEIKYRNNRVLALEMGQTFGRKLQKCDLRNTFDVLTPVPLSQSKQKQRGFNQSHEIALGLESSLGIPLDNGLLRRTVDGKSQTRKSRTDRYYQLQNSFEACGPEVSGKSVLLVDDVSTTGATAEICMGELHRAGAHKLGLLCLAFRADY